MADTIDTLATALHELRDRLGADAFNDKRRVISLLSDKLPGAKREIRAVGTAIDEGVPIALSENQRQNVGWEMDHQTDRMANSTGLDVDLVRQTVRALAYSLDLGPLPSIYNAARVTSPPVPPPPPPVSGWVGVSVTPGPVSPPPPPISPHPPVAPEPWRSGNQAWQGAQGGYNRNLGPGTNQNWSQGTYVPPVKPKMAGINKILLWAVIALVAFIGWAIWLGAHDDDKTNGATPGVSASAAAPAGVAAGPGGESQDFGVAPQSVLQSNVGSPTPLTSPVATTITTAQLQEMMKLPAGAPYLIDVWGGAHPTTIKGAKHWPVLGAGGTFDDDTQKTVNANLPGIVSEEATGRPLVFFCAGAKCWESYNAALRANAAGVKNLFWYRGGMAAWEAVNGETQALPANTNQTSDNTDTPTPPGDTIEKRASSDYRP